MCVKDFKIVLHGGKPKMSVGVSVNLLGITPILLIHTLKILHGAPLMYFTYGRCPATDRYHYLDCFPASFSSSGSTMTLLRIKHFLKIN